MESYPIDYCSENFKLCLLLGFVRRWADDLSFAELIFHRISFSAGFDGGTKFTIFVRMKFCIFVIVQSTKAPARIAARIFKSRYQYRAQTAAFSKKPCDIPFISVRLQKYMYSQLIRRMHLRTEEV